MSYGLLFIVVVMCLGLIGMALVLMGEGSDPSEWLGEHEAPVTPELKPILDPKSSYLDHVRQRIRELLADRRLEKTYRHEPVNRIERLRRIL